ncbi:DUF2868 domain-containing protein [Thiohalocapsa marina]|uniref:DUF2868 domain-containing protein n=1 Tax=Thiohalocapsa marina TaxID=424902 RepID=A0A5M8FT10_9GAMM|nr:DUF2868 domain-containing protein [Thiohalocapsa marina]KAA6186652.1 DUF2868 domain-containing protein [Thiohalocapsa marina]
MDPFNRPRGDADIPVEPDSDQWSVPDLIDFDYFVNEDERRARESAAERRRLAERDRGLYRERIQAACGKVPEHTPRHRSQALRRWLSTRRRAEDPALRGLLPGAVYARGQRLVTTWLGVGGFVVGVGVASALLHYDGQHPVNVSWYIFVLVLVQLLLVGLTVGLWYARRRGVIRAAVEDFSLLGHLIKPLFGRTARWVQRQRLAHVPPDVRERAEARQGLLQGHYALYGPAAYLPMLIPVQVFGIGFNVGAILITVALEWFTDLAFGWGSALNVGPETIHAVAHVIALPWSWLFGEGVGVPTLEQVAGTRIALKDPLFLFDADNLRSWRWFLVLAVFTYGLLPRLALLGLSLRKQRRTLAELPFTHQRTQALYARMLTPSLETRGDSGAGPEMPIPAPLQPLTTERAAPREQPPAPPETTAEPKPVPEPKPGPEAEPAPKAETEPKPAPEPEPEPEPEPKPKPEPEPEREQAAEPELKLEPERKPAPRPELALQPETTPAPQRKPTPAQRREPAPKPKPQPKPAQKGEPKPESEPKPEPEPKPESKPEPKPERKAEQRPEPKPAPQPRPAPPARPSLAPGATSPGRKPALPEIAADACILLIHVDVADVLEAEDHGRLQRLLLEQSGWRVAASATFGGGRRMAEQALGLIHDAGWQAPPARVALLQDGSQPPITESLRFLRAVRAAAGEQAQMLLTLVGDPEGDDPLPPLSAFDFGDWQRKIEQLGDPYLRLEMLTGPNEEAV